MNTSPVCTKCPDNNYRCRVDDDNDFMIEVRGIVFGGHCPTERGSSIVATIGDHEYIFPGTLRGEWKWNDNNGYIGFFRVDTDDLTALKDFLSQIIVDLDILFSDPCFDSIGIDIDIVFHTMDPNSMDPLCAGARLKNEIWVDIIDRKIERDIQSALMINANGCGWL